MNFEWDEAKAIANLRKHGVTFNEASTVFNDPFYVVFADPDHSEDEERFIIVGVSTSGILLVVSFSQRRKNIRLISARLATRTERKSYEQEI